MSDKFQNKYRTTSTRAPWWNYCNSGACFVTICINNRECCFGNINDGKMEFTPIGEIAHLAGKKFLNIFRMFD
jgi:putative transposase